MGSAVVLGDLRILSSNMSVVRSGLDFSPSATIFVASLAALTLAASVLGAGVLGDRYGMKRMFLGGAWACVVSAVKASVASTFYGLGTALFSLAGIILFVRDAAPKLAGSGVSPEEAGELLSVTTDSTGGAGMNAERTQWIISQAASGMIGTAHTLNVALTAFTLAAAVVAVVLFRRAHRPADVPASER